MRAIYAVHMNTNVFDGSHTLMDSNKESSMTTTDRSQAGPMQAAASIGLRGWFIVLAVGAAITYFFVSGHTVNVTSALPFLIFLACPVMMFFMMNGMNHGGQNSGTMK
jgi:Flp pilus assembly protein TadB